MKPGITDDYRLYVNIGDASITFPTDQSIDSTNLYTIEDIKRNGFSTLNIDIENDSLSEGSLNLLYALLSITHIKQVCLLTKNVDTLSPTAIDLIVQILNRSHNICILEGFKLELLNYEPIRVALKELVDTRTTALCFLYDSSPREPSSVLHELIKENTKISYYIFPFSVTPRKDYSQCKQTTNLPKEAYDALKPCISKLRWQRKVKPYIRLYYNELYIETFTICDPGTNRHQLDCNNMISDLNTLLYYMKAVDRAILCKALMSSTDSFMPIEIQTGICRTLLELYVHNKGALPKECIVQVEEVEEEENIRANQAPTAPIEQEKSNQSLLQRCIAYTCEHKLAILGCSALLITSAYALCRIYSGNISISSIINYISPNTSLSI